MKTIGIFGHLAPLMAVALSVERKPFVPAPYHPTDEDWGETWKMLCGFCEHAGRCEIVERMIEMKNGGPWPEGGWITDPGAGVTCQSYQPIKRPPMPRQQLRRLLRKREANLPPMCGGCAAQKGSEASVSRHTRRDYQEAVRSKSPFVCHEDKGAEKRLCGGWCRAVRAKAHASQPDRMSA